VVPVKLPDLLRAALDLDELPVVAGLPMMAVGGNLCPTCHGQKGRRRTVREWVTCTRCGGKGGKKTGKVFVPCSGCNGAGGKNVTGQSWEDCRACGGTGRK
jgi:hypothetical protein